MELFKIIYKAIEGLKKSVDGLLKNMDKALKKQDALLFVDGSNVTSYRDLQLDILKNASFEGTTLFMTKPDTIWQFGYGYYDSEDSAGSDLSYSDGYLIKHKDNPIIILLNLMYDAINVADVLAVLSLDCAKGMNFEYLFDEYTNLREVRNIKRVEGANNIKGMFSGCENLVHIDDFATNDITDMSNTFYRCKKLKKLPKIDTSKVTSFCRTLSLSGVEFIPDSWTFDKALTFEMFANGSMIEDITMYAPLATTLEYAFHDCKKLTAINIVVDKAIFLESLCSGCKELKYASIGFGGTSINSQYLFHDCEKLEQFEIQTNSSTFQALSEAFFNCQNLKTISGDISLYNSSGCYIGNTFTGCYSLENFDGFYFPEGNKVVNTYNFSDCPKLTIESMQSIMNRLNNQQADLIFNTEAFNKLTPEDIAIAVNKGWSVSSAN